MLENATREKGLQDAIESMSKNSFDFRRASPRRSRFSSSAHQMPKSSMNPSELKKSDPLSLLTPSEARAIQQSRKSRQEEIHEDDNGPMEKGE